jgi:hypothetical protein
MLEEGERREEVTGENERNYLACPSTKPGRPELLIADPMESHGRKQKDVNDAYLSRGVDIWGWHLTFLGHQQTNF